MPSQEYLCSWESPEDAARRSHGWIVQIIDECHDRLHAVTQMKDDRYRMLQEDMADLRAEARDDILRLEKRLRKSKKAHQSLQGKFETLEKEHLASQARELELIAQLKRTEDELATVRTLEEKTGKIEKEGVAEAHEECFSGSEGEL